MSGREGDWYEAIGRAIYTFLQMGSRYSLYAVFYSKWQGKGCRASVLVWVLACHRHVRGGMAEHVEMQA